MELSLEDNILLFSSWFGSGLIKLFSFSLTLLTCSLFLITVSHSFISVKNWQLVDSSLGSKQLYPWELFSLKNLLFEPQGLEQSLLSTS